MPNQFNIPGLSDSIKEITKLNESVNKLAKDLLDSAVNGEKLAKSLGGSQGLKDYIELQKKANTVKKETETISDKVTKKEKELENAQGDLAKKLAIATLAVQKQNAENKNYAKSQDENRTALEKFNAKILESTRVSKELGAQMALMALEGKKNTAEYKELEAQFTKAAATSKQLNDSYRDISKTAGDNRALVGSYSSELKGHFEMINSSINGLKGNIASGNWSGAFNDARTVVQGFGNYLKKSTDSAKEFGNEMKANGGVFGSLKTKVSDAGTSIVNFFKPAEQNSSKMKEGLDRIMIGFKQNTVAISETTAVQIEANVAGEVANDTAKSGTIFTNLWAGAQLLFAGATGVATGAVAVLGVALAAIGIGLIIAAVALLAEGLSNFRPLMNFLKDSMAGVGAVVEMLSDKITQFVVNIKSVGDLLSKIGDIIAHPIDSIKKIGNEMAETAKKGAELSEATRKLTAAQKDYTIESKNVENQIKTLMLQAKNRTTSEEDRIKLLKRAQELEEGMHNKKVSMWQQEMELNLQNLKNKGKITDAEIALLRKGDQAALDSLKKRTSISSGEIDTFREIMQKKADIDGEGITIRERSQNQIDTLNDKAQKKKEDADKKIEEADKKKLDRQKKMAEMAISTMKLTLDNEIASYDQSQHIASDNLAHVQAISLMKQKIAEAEAQKELIGLDKNSIDAKAILQKKSEEYQKIEIEKSKAIKDIQLGIAKFELELYDINTYLILDNQKNLTDDLINEQRRRIKESLALHLEQSRAELGIDKDSTDEKLLLSEKIGAKLSANELKYLGILKTAKSKATKDDEKLVQTALDIKVKAINEEEKTENRKFNLINKGSFANAKNQLKNEEIRLKSERELYKGNAEKTAEIDLQLAENKQKLDKLTSEQKANALQSGLSMLIDIAGKESAVGKAAATAQALINTYQGITKTIAEYPGPIGIALSALTGTVGFMNVAKINGVQGFYEGTENAPYTGKAIVDEIGAEIHMDKKGNIKSFGSDSGARLTDIVQGDKIIPADISAIIRQTMFSNGIKDSQKVNFDYAEMGKYFDKSASKIVLAVNNQKPSSPNIIIQKDLSLRATFKGRKV